MTKLERNANQSRSMSLSCKTVILLAVVSVSCPFEEYGGVMCPLGCLDQSQTSVQEDHVICIYYFDAWIPLITLHFYGAA